MPFQSLSLRCLANPRVRTAIGIVRLRLSVTIGLRGDVIGIMYGIFTHVVMGFPNTRLPTPQSHLTVLTLHILFLLSICFEHPIRRKARQRVLHMDLYSSNLASSLPRPSPQSSLSCRCNHEQQRPPLSISSPHSSVAGYFVGTVVAEEVLACRVEL